MNFPRSNTTVGDIWRRATQLFSSRHKATSAINGPNTVSPTQNRITPLLCSVIIVAAIVYVWHKYYKRR